MPRTMREILEHADELASVFEDHDPNPDNIRRVDPPLRSVAAAFRSAAAAQEALTSAIASARDRGHTWSEIADMVGTSAEAARQRYGKAS